MEFTITTMRYSNVSEHFEIHNEVIQAEKIILETSAKRYEIGIGKAKKEKSYGYPNQFIRCLIMSEYKGVKKMHGYFTKIALHTDPNNYNLEIILLEEVITKEQVNLYFKNEYKDVKKVANVDVQTISVEDFLTQTKISLMKEARKLYKRRKNVK